MPPHRSGSTLARDMEHTGTSRSRRSVQHVTRACDGCRKRKAKCDGVRPSCTACADKSMLCEYNEEDKRKTHLEQMEDMRARMNHLETLVGDLIETMNGRATRSTLHSHQTSSAHPTNNGSMAYAPGKSSSRLDGLAGLSVSRSHQGAGDGSVLDEDDDETGFQRADRSGGALVRYGPTSLWAHKRTRSQLFEASYDPIIKPGDWVDWARHLPPGLGLTEALHDRALTLFGSYYGSWGMTVDMPAFLADLTACNLVSSTRQVDRRPARTVHYSPLLHCCVLYLGLILIRNEQPALVRAMEEVFWEHTSKLLISECDQAALSSLKAYNLLANCVHFARMATRSLSEDVADRPVTTGYLYSGMAIAGVHALGLNIDPTKHIARGSMTLLEQNLRDSSFWTIYITDTIRAFAAGRQPMLLDITVAALPHIDPSIDSQVWTLPNNPGSWSLEAYGLVGRPSLRSTTFHWTARLAIICRSVLDALYNPHTVTHLGRSHILALSQQLDTWKAAVPIHDPASVPMPHMILLHLTYHLTDIFIHRPSYRDLSGIAASRCNSAALRIVDLVTVLDRVHGIRHGHHNLINIIFAGATIFLLRLRANGSTTLLDDDDLSQFDRCVDFMGRLGETWMEAAKGHQILMALRSECQPQGVASAVDDGTIDGRGSGSPAQDLNEWLTSNDLWSLMATEPMLPWDQTGSPHALKL